ncbi:helix-turn-helix domain-containing protein [Streptococcus ovuberis]|uniref:Helix-turn-helix domain-containing protein n=1 Tax=Streptococcus ovuberis TaxID=1936207 RepID=A0A7X6S1K8_9STRE|nr:helix-turn-helix domain-containing protein [Streptococcus ovuberis]
MESRINHDRIKKYLVIKAVCEGKKQKIRACVELGLSKRQINRLLKAYKELGKIALVHGNRCKKTTHAMPPKTRS